MNRSPWTVCRVGVSSLKKAQGPKRQETSKVDICLPLYFRGENQHSESQSDKPWHSLCGPIPGSSHQLIPPPGTPFLRSLLTLMPPAKVLLSSWLKCCPCPQGLSPGCPSQHSSLRRRSPFIVYVSPALTPLARPQESRVTTGLGHHYSPPRRTRPAPEQALHRQLLDDDGTVQRRRSPDETRRKTQRDKYPLVWGCRPSLRVLTTDMCAPCPVASEKAPALLRSAPPCPAAPAVPAPPTQACHPLGTTYKGPLQCRASAPSLAWRAKQGEWRGGHAPPFLILWGLF
ncbi:uncharacterized protein LOC108315296 [Cebus imitator]|uniref:uncharacterized protein LOC108315296 n=1 Tax=Cebus imitator TaxID=2715852 RepID=UPI0018986EB1|nr:uncharacterized protein LOC108315296 [Cebus imitator]